MSIQLFDDFLPRDLYHQSFDTARELLTRGERTFYTNKCWQPEIQKDSFPVLIHQIYEESELYKNICKVITDKIDFKIANNQIMFYYWTQFSYIPWHSDSETHDGAITIHLNWEWDPDFGGYFLYKENDEIKAIVPKRNLAVLQTDGVEHTTTPVHISGQIRYTIQAFLEK